MSWRRSNRFGLPGRFWKERRREKYDDKRPGDIDPEEREKMGQPVQRTFRALTLWRPWDQSVLYGGKRIENRNWAPWNVIIGELIALHAGAKYDKDGAMWMIENGLYTPPSSSTSPKGIVGVARVVDFVKESDNPWFFGEYGWRLEDVQALARPIVCTGAQRLWNVKGKALEELLEALYGEKGETKGDGRGRSTQS